nr:ParB/RepB/Spo0J family partition protein [Ectobacillus ponti]
MDAREEETIKDLKISQIRPNPYQPRKHFHKEAIQELKLSIQEHGILQPIIVRKSIKGYEIVAGERRFRAAKEAKLDVIPAIVRELNDQQMMELALLENLQREDLTPIEEAAAYQMLMDALKVTQEQLAKRLGKSRPHITNYIRLLSLPAFVQELVSNGVLSMGHGRTLLSLKDKEKLKPVVEKIQKEELNVRQLEQLIQQLNEEVPRETKPPQKEKSIFFKAQEDVLQERFGTSVRIKEGSKKGKIEIEFFNKDDLQRILDLLSGEA